MSSQHSVLLDPQITSWQLACVDCAVLCECRVWNVDLWASMSARRVLQLAIARLATCRNPLWPVALQAPEVVLGQPYNEKVSD
jgi:hypothetical protein